MPVRRDSQRVGAADWDLTLQCGLFTHELRAMDRSEALETLEAAWSGRREALLSDYRVRHPGRRPWAFWEFELGEPRPFSGAAPAETDRLVEFGVVDDVELQDCRDAEERRIGLLTHVQDFVTQPGDDF
jgi:hypothetical protein